MQKSHCRISLGHILYEVTKRLDVPSQRNLFMINTSFYRQLQLHISKQDEWSCVDQFIDMSTLVVAQYQGSSITPFSDQTVEVKLDEGPHICIGPRLQGGDQYALRLPDPLSKEDCSDFLKAIEMQPW